MYDQFFLWTIVTFICKNLVEIIERFLSSFQSNRMNQSNGLSFDLRKYRYEPITFDHLRPLIDRIKIKLIELGFDTNCKLNDEFEKLMKSFKKVLEHADRKCCGQIRSNGCFSISKLLYRYICCFEAELFNTKSTRKLNGLVKDFEILCDLMIKIVEIICRMIDDTDLDDEQKRKEFENELLKYDEFHRSKIYSMISVTKNDSFDDTSNDKLTIDQDLNRNRIKNTSFINTSNGQQFNSSPLISPNLETIFESAYEAIHQPTTKHKEIIFRKYFMIFYDSGLIKLFKIYTSALLLLCTPFYKYPLLLFNSVFRSKTLVKILSYPTHSFPFELWNITELKVTKFKMKSKNFLI